MIAVVCFATAFISFDNLVETQLLSKSYALIAGALVCALLVVSVPGKASIRLDLPTLLVVLFISFILLRMLLSGNTGLNFLLASSLLLFYFVFKAAGLAAAGSMNLTIVCACLCLALYGVLQFSGVFFVRGAFRMIGNFDNPAGIAACLAAGFPFCFALFDRTKPLKWLGAASTIVITLAVMLSGSRAGILAIAAAGLIYLADRQKQFIKRHKFIILAAVFLVGVCCAGLFLLKKDSALGRVLIWKTSLYMIAEKPLLGHGPGAFRAEYMERQAAYFKAHPDSRYSLLADNVTHPFNEYLSLAVEYGIAGLIVLLGVIVVILRSGSFGSPYLLCVVSVAVFSCFSYPLRYAFVILLVAYSLSRIDGRRVFEKKLTWQAKAAVVVIVAAASVVFVRDLRFESRWGNLVRLGSLGQTSELVGDYDVLYREWNHNSLFLYNYGAVLNHAGRYSESLRIMELCSRYFNDYDVQLIQGDNHLQLQQYEEALNSYEEASFMCPGRFVPLYKIFQLYKSCGMNQQAYRLAGRIVEKPVKINSAVIEMIKREMREYIDKTGADRYE